MRARQLIVGGRFQHRVERLNRNLEDTVLEHGDIARIIPEVANDLGPGSIEGLANRAQGIRSE